MKVEIITNREELAQVLNPLRSSGKAVGLVPTMGALHEGHASLVERSVRENDATVVSVFVNPTQFNDKRDYESYPRDTAADTRLLDALGADIAFVPPEEEMYPEPDTRAFSYPPLDTVMEGTFRPGHFRGVCQIVSKLFYAVRPARAYFGEKDFQQIAVVRAMAEALKLPVEIRSCPTVREADGLALSSRNTLLRPDERAAAANISKALYGSLAYAKGHSLEETKEFVVSFINRSPLLNVQYFEIVDGVSLQSLAGWRESGFIVGCAAVFCGRIPVRLIDNIAYKRP